MKNFSFIPVALLATGVVLSVNSRPAEAFNIGFYNATNNGSTNVAPNFVVDVNDLGAGKVEFKFTNTNNVAYATINDIYFGTKSAFPQYLSTNNVAINNGPGVEYSAGASPGNPGGGINWDAAFSADPKNQNGVGGKAVDPGEYVSFVFNLTNGTQYDQLEQLFNTGTLALALHAQSIGGSGGSSDKFASHSSITANDIPEPLTILGTGAAVGFAGLFRREQSKRQSKVKEKA